MTGEVSTTDAASAVGAVWSTVVYKSASFGGLKPGVGLLLDLRTVRALHRVQVGFAAPGVHVELRVADVRPEKETDARTVASAVATGEVAVLTPPAGTTARFVLVWITQLPRDGKGYRAGVAALQVS